MENRIYLDYSATTPTDPRVVEKMMPYFTKIFGNAASRNHSYGWEAEEAVEKAREQIADLIGASSKEIIFTSGSTESNNIALQGIAEMHKEKGNHIITCLTEHKAILDPAHYLESQGYKVTFLKVDEQGMISLDDLKNAITEKTILISLMAANNEIGVLHPVKEIGEIARERGVFFHTDATQAVGKVPINVEEMNIDLLSLSGHKIYAPKGAGALYVRRRNPRVRLAPVVHGGGHERGMRSGTLNVTGIVGLGEACAICKEELPLEMKRLTHLRDKLHKGLTEKVDYLVLNGHPEHRLPGLLNLSFSYIEGESLMMGIENIAVSSGSACTSASLEPSYVLRALGVGDEAAHSSIRFSLGRFTTEEEVAQVTKQMVDVATRLREMSPLYEMVKEGIDLSSIQWTGH
jgi:cysteine desulfurase